MKKTKNLFGNMADTAIDRLREFEPNALDKSPDGYYVAYSGGKDSDVILDLVRRSGVKYTAHYHLTTCDPPEVVRHVKAQSDVEIQRPPLTMWQLIRKKKMPPRRQARYCCEVLKEGGGQGRIVVTGIRWGESNRRSKRRMIETCYRSKTKQFLNVIIDWTTENVWNYINTEGIEYCSLYDEGFKRLGCVLCPMARDVKRQMERWPRIARAWEKAVKATWNPFGTAKCLNQKCKHAWSMQKSIEEAKHDGLVVCPKCKGIEVIVREKKTKFESPEAYWQWWLDRDAPSRKIDDGPMMFFED